MAENRDKNEEIIIIEDSETSGSGDFKEKYMADEFDGYEEDFDSDEFDGYDEGIYFIEDYQKNVEIADWDQGEDEKTIEEKESKALGIVTAVFGVAILVAAVVLLISIGNISLKKLNFFSSSVSEEKLTLMDVGNELDAIDRIGGNKFEEIFEAQKLRSQEAKKKELEEAFKFDEVESKKDLINVSVQLTSLLKDLKIKVVNDNKKLIANVPFIVEVKDPSGNVSTYTDDNKDGIIYLEGLKGGDYSVKTLSVKGYEDKYSFAEKADSINVKETLEYKKVDVSNEVKKEKDVNAKKEDPGANKPVQPKSEEPKDEPDPTVTGNEPSDKPEGAVFGIDVSKWNGDIDWTAVAADGVSYAIIRCGFRGSTEGGLIEDAKFWDNIQGASANGIKVGVYFFSQAVNEVEAVEEASMVLGMVNGYSISYPIFLDVETSGGGRGDQISSDERTAVCKAFCETIRNSGYTAGIYSNKTWFEEKMNVGELTSYKLWLAQYAKEVTYAKSRYDIWQYSDSGNVLGIPTGVDLNMSYLGY